MAEPRQAARPLSPHLQIYRLTVTMVMSIVHRITGAGLYAGTLLLAWWLVALASGPEAYAVFEGFIGSWFGRLVLFGYTWALIHHMLGGIRHFVWDFGKGFEIGTANLMAWGTILGSVALTVLVWIAGYAMMGAL
ncbi:MAG: succinate dehydrogenase, cytochrome b556 subunit [Parvibaculum sp.]|uniref:succinate dehydrogenase, cytochrome b556 subunit n=1 Tax=Parvibaculum sp. TaxID=2024848 RepID=UPI002715F63C|nr:succinate dehydrogenase, cytochrome b556 subunit [Parvibaculum sp.]MDO8837737.1 succinate dehydrogenase, cytochrome b556 subunit [Parvibaculum sp.]MDP2123206.1 succinate dehydrogenase, cytochrome b556 subunit [Parvibaculum sp.]